MKPNVEIKKIKMQIFRAILEYLNKHYHYLCVDVVVPQGSHIHANPKRGGNDEESAKV